MILWIKMFEFANVRKPSLRRKRKAELNHNGSIGDHDMAKQALPSPKTLRQLLNYDHESGKLFWIARLPCAFSSERHCKTWNTRFAGKEAFTATSSGALHGSVNGNNILAHRIAWAIYYGEWPKCQIDHINHDRQDNRICNLREATPSENGRNRRSRPNSSSQYLGVCFDAARNKWKAEITAMYKSKFLGRFDCEIEAAKAYDQAAKKIHGEFAFLNFNCEFA